MSSGEKIAVVIPWFGEDQKGGAEQQAWQIAHRLQKAGCEVTVLSTCSRSFLDPWDQNYYTAKTTFIGKLTLKRFKVNSRKPRKFNRIVAKILGKKSTDLSSKRPPLSAEDEDVYWQENINSDDLIDHIRSAKNVYDRIIFLPYLFPITLKGILAAPEKSYLQACLHDEAYAYLEKTKAMMCSVRGLLFNSSGELELAKRIYGNWIEKKSFVVGEGIEQKSRTSLEHQALSLPKQFILCLGRKSREKGTEQLLEAFTHFCLTHKNKDLHLVFAGPETIAPSYLRHDFIHDFGVVSEDAKTQLLVQCLALINPSPNESFSRVIYEAWILGRPVVVNENCLATYTALIESGFAGWAVSSTQTYCKTFNHLSQVKIDETNLLGEKGRIFAKAMSDWDKVIARYFLAFKKTDTLAPQNRERESSLALLFLIADKSSLHTFQTEIVEIADYCRSLSVPCSCFLDFSHEGRDYFHDRNNLETVEIRQHLQKSLDRYRAIILIGEPSSKQTKLMLGRFTGALFWRTLATNGAEGEADTPPSTSYGAEGNLKVLKIDEKIPLIIPSRLFQYKNIEQRRFNKLNDNDLNLFLGGRSLTQLNQDLLIEFLLKIRDLSEKNLRLFFPIEHKKLIKPFLTNLGRLSFKLETFPPQRVSSTDHQLADLVLWIEGDNENPCHLLASLALSRPVLMIDSPNHSIMHGIDHFSIRSPAAQSTAAKAAVNSICSKNNKNAQEKPDDKVLSLYRPGVLHSRFLEGII